MARFVGIRTGTKGGRPVFTQAACGDRLLSRLVSGQKDGRPVYVGGDLPTTLAAGDRGIAVRQGDKDGRPVFVGASCGAPCCFGLLPSVSPGDMEVTLTVTSGSCACLDGITATMDFNSGFWLEDASSPLYVARCGLGTKFRLQCLLDGSEYRLALWLMIDNGTFAEASVFDVTGTYTFTCDPFSVTISEGEFLATVPGGYIPCTAGTKFSATIVLA